MSYEPEPGDSWETRCFLQEESRLQRWRRVAHTKGQEMRDLKTLITLGICVGERPVMTLVPTWTCCSVLRPGGPRWGC